VFAASDLIALGAIAVLDEVGLRVPEDVAFVGYDGIPAAASFRPPLTTVRQPLEHMGRLAADHLCGLIAGEADEPLHVTVDPELVVRDSCGSADTADRAEAPWGLLAED
jgi:DNA-binding LacI/PurR family transcriptional regulator